MNIIKLVLIIIIMFALRNLYHKMFRVVYFDAVTAIFREFVICFLIAVVIVFGGFELIGDIFTPKEKDPGFYGTYHNLALLEGGDSDTFLILFGGDARDGKMGIKGTSMGVGSLPWIDIDIETEVSKKNTFTCTDDTSHITLTIKADPKKHTLEVVQETGLDDGRFPFTGKYVDDDTWEGMRDQINTTKEEILAAQTPNKWIDDYFGNYELRTGGSGPSPVRISIYDSTDPLYFTFDYYAEIDGTATGGRFEIPYPSGSVEPGSIACMSEDGPIAFAVQGYSESGNTEIIMTEFPDVSFIGTYIPTTAYENIFDPISSDVAAPEVNEPSASSEASPDTSNSGNENGYPTYTDTPEEFFEYYPEDIPRSWDGVYTCASDGPDGTKTLTITQTTDSTLSISLYHLYADGREDTLDIVADIGTYNHDQYFASYTDSKRIYFTLEDNSTVEVVQHGIYPDIDLEFYGTYTSEN